MSNKFKYRKARRLKEKAKTMQWFNIKKGCQYKSRKQVEDKHDEREIIQ